MGRDPLIRTATVDTPHGIDAVYDTITDHAVLAERTDHIKSVNVKSRRDELYLAEERLVLGGRQYLCMVRHRRHPPHTHDYTIVGGDAKGSRIQETFRSTPHGTRIDIVMDWKGGLRGIVKGQAICDDYVRMIRAAC